MCGIDQVVERRTYPGQSPRRRHRSIVPRHARVDRCPPGRRGSPHQLYLGLGMPPSADQADRFRQLHDGPEPLVMPNPWDVGSARLLAHLGFQALATTSSGFAGTPRTARRQRHPRRGAAHAAAIAGATDLPVNGDLENGFGDAPEEVAATITGAIDAGLAGGSIEDYTGRRRRADLRARRRRRAGGGGRGGGARGAGAVRAHRSRRELPARPGRPRRHDRAPARRSRRQGPTCSTPRACATLARSPRSSARSTGR